MLDKPDQIKALIDNSFFRAFVPIPKGRIHLSRPSKNTPLPGIQALG
jgi:hypothetical protein